jgi:hypothetical protein
MAAVRCCAAGVKEQHKPTQIHGQFRACLHANSRASASASAPVIDDTLAHDTNGVRP